MHRNLLMKYNDLPVETQSPYSTLSSTNQKPKKLTNIYISSGSSCSDTDSEFEYVLEKNKQTTLYFKSKRGEDIDHEVISNKPESESDTAETIVQHTRPKRNKRPKQLFRYDTLEIHHTITHEFFIV